MIDEVKTLEEFGYTSQEAKQNHKVVAFCEVCKEHRQISKIAALKSSMCSRCQRVSHIKTVRYDPTGRKHSEETKRKIGESNKKSQKKGKESSRYGKKVSEEHKEKTRQLNASRVWSDESRKKASESKKGKKLSQATRRKMSEMRLAKPTRIGHKASHGKGQYYIAKNGESIWVRSSWELKTAMYLDKQGLNWKCEPEAFSIQYEVGGLLKQGTFRPDFLVEKTSGLEFWEVKGWWRDDAKAKFTAFTNQYPHLIVRLLQKQNLVEMGIL